MNKVVRKHVSRERARTTVHDGCPDPAGQSPVSWLRCRSVNSNTVFCRDLQVMKRSFGLGSGGQTSGQDDLRVPSPKITIEAVAISMHFPTMLRFFDPGFQE